MRNMIVMLLVALALYCASGRANDEATISNLLDAIRCVETRNRTGVVVHADGVSIGDHGVTIAGACGDLVERGCLLRLPTVSELADPATNRMLARLYLVLMYERHGSWWAAVGRYHGGTKAQRDEYARNVWSKRRKP